MALAAELLKKFVDEDVPISKKLRAATNLFVCDEFCFVSRREELVFDWLLILCKGDACNEFTVFSVFRDCLRSDHMMNLKVLDIKTATKKSFIEILINALNQVSYKEHDTKEQKEHCSDNMSIEDPGGHYVICECALLTLETEVFLFYFRKNINKYIELSVLMLKCAGELNNVQMVLRYIRSFKKFFNLSLKKEDIFEVFIQDLIIIIVDVFNMLKTSHRDNSCNTELLKFDTNESINSLKSEILLLIKYVVFPNHIHKQFTMSLSSLFGTGEIRSFRVRFLFQFLIKTSSECVTGREQTVSSLYSFIFESFILGCQNNSSATYEFFVVLCLFVGFQPNLEVVAGKDKSFLLEPEKVSSLLNCKIGVPDRKVSHLVLKDTMALLQNIYINIGEKVKNVSFKHWIQSLMIYLMTIETSPFFHDIIFSVVEINPLIVEPIVSKILKHHLLQRRETDQEKLSYRRLFIGILRLFIKLHKMEELIFYNILSTLKELIKEHRKNDQLDLLKVPVCDIIPEGFGLLFCDAVAMLSGDMCNIFLTMFKNVFRQEVVRPFEHRKCDEGHHLYLCVVEYLLVQFLGGVRIAEQNVLQQICVQFMELLMVLRESIGSLGIALIQQNCGAAELACFLRLSHTVGELQLLLLIYSPWSSQQKALLPDTSLQSVCPSDLHCLLTFLNAEQWKEVNEKVTNLGDKECREAWNALLEQKLRAWSVIGNCGVDNSKIHSTMCCSLIESLMNSENKSWKFILSKFFEVPHLANLLPPEELLTVTEYIVENASSCNLSSDISDVFQNAMLSEALVVALGWASVKKIGTLFAMQKGFRRKQQEIKCGLLVNESLELLSFSDIISHKMSSSKLKQCWSLLGGKFKLACGDILMKNKMGDMSAEIDMKVVFHHLVLLRNLPLVFLPFRVKAAFVFVDLAILLALQELVIYCENIEEISELEDEERKHVTLVNMKIICLEIFQGLLEDTILPYLRYVDMGLFTQVLLRESSYSKTLLLFLFRLALIKEDSVVDLVNAATASDCYLEKKFNQHESPTSVALLEALKQNSSSSGETCVKFKGASDTVLNGIVNRTVEHMNSENMSESCIVQLMETLSCILSFPRKYPTIAPHIDKIVLCALSVVEEGNESSVENVQNAELLLESVMKNYMLIGTPMCSYITYRVYKNYRLTGASPTFLKLLKHASEDDCKALMGSLESKVKLVSRGEIKLFPDTSLAVALMQMEDSLLTSLDSMLLSLASGGLLNIFHGNYGDNLQDFTNFLMAVMKRRKVPLPGIVADVILITVMCIMEEQPNSIDYVLKVTPNALKLLKLMVQLHFSVLRDRIPAFAMAFKSIFHAIVINCSSDLDIGIEDSVKLSECTLEFEQLTNDLLKDKRAFIAVSQFIMADLLLELERTTISHKFKIHIMNSLCKFVSLCDTYAIGHLYQALPPASVELFKSVMHDYKRFHCYSGKV